MRGTFDGLILRESAYGESDKLLTVLTADEGKVFMIAKGVRSLKSKNLALCRLFTYANFEYYEKKRQALARRRLCKRQLFRA